MMSSVLIEVDQTIPMTPPLYNPGKGLHMADDSVDPWSNLILQI
jgi:hypothetical protein